MKHFAKAFAIALVSAVFFIGAIALLEWSLPPEGVLHIWHLVIAVVWGCAGVGSMWAMLNGSWFQA